MNRNWINQSIAWLPLGLLLLGASSIAGCSNDAFCFNCTPANSGGSGGAGGSSTGGSGGSSGSAGNIIGGNAGSAGFAANAGNAGTSAAGSAGCTPSEEICDGKDNDCNGTDDDVDPSLLTNASSCGSCNNNCLTSVLGTTSFTCTDGVCGYDTCVEGSYDLDGDKTNGCEYSCTKTSDTETCDGVDNNCDGEKDEGFDFCSTDTCGGCSPCSFGNAVAGECQLPPNMPNAACTGNALCVITQCPPGFSDVDKNPANGCETPCEPTNPPTEVCDGVDNDCNGKIDAADDLSGDPAIGVQCFGGTDGVCALAQNAGVSACVGAVVVCSGPNVIIPGQISETCDNVDNDCDGVVDNSPSDVGVACGGLNGSSVGKCLASVKVCNAGGVIDCPGQIPPDNAEECNGIDDDCDDVIDGTRFSPNLPCNNDAQCDDGNASTLEACMPLASSAGKVCAYLPAPSGQDCLVPPTPPMGISAVCQKGTWSCIGGTLLCDGAIEPLLGDVDSCNQDRNCDGTYTGVLMDLSSDPLNCGSCNNVCNPVNNVQQICQSGQCVPDPASSCAPGYMTCDANNPCQYQCTPTSATEFCNGVDDDCNCMVDDNVANPPSAQAVCGANPASDDNFCKPYNVASNANGVQVVCQSSAWQCKFSNSVPAGTYCDPDSNASTPANCAAATDTCDGRDNNCDGQSDGPFLGGAQGKGKTCYSDDAAPGTHGACRTAGQYVCNGAGTGTQCNAVKADCNSLPGGCTEVCDGIDNDCDGSIDETFNAKGTNTSYFVKPSVTKVANSLWIYSYEASRPNATNTTPGSGNGYHCSGAGCAAGTTAPAGTPLDKTKSCSVQGKIPWFNVTPIEVEQTCNAMGGRACTTAEWMDSCDINPASGTTCTYGYATRGAACTSSYTASKFCNIGPSWDFSMVTSGDQDGLLVTGSPSLQNCYADWSNLLGNTAATNKVFDITGNLREIVRQTANSSYKLMGGAYSSPESGSTCAFDFYTVNTSFQFFDTGFRCCFTSDPTL